MRENPAWEFGCVLFDLAEDEAGRLVPRLGSGWASAEGGKAERFKGPEELPSQMLWWTNMSKDQLWLSGGVKFQKLRHSGFLGQEMGGLMKETGLMPKTIGPNIAAEGLSEIFSRAMRKARRFFEIPSFRESTLSEDIRVNAGEADYPKDTLLDTALFSAWQENSFIGGTEGGFFVPMRIPRVSHARTILSRPVPIGGWEFAGVKDMPLEEQRFEWFSKSGRPALVKVKFGQLKQNGLLLSRKDGLAKGMRKKEREWMTFEEATWWSAYQDISIVGGFVAEGEATISSSPNFEDWGESANLSLAAGLCAENYWTGMSTFARHPVSKKMTLVSPRAVWFRSADRFFCFSKALELHRSGLKVVAYGGGTIIVELAARDLGKAEDAAEKLGLTLPASFWEKGKPVIRRDPLDLKE